MEDANILSEVLSITSTLVNLGGDLKPVGRENIHLTLKFLGYISPAKVADVKSSLATLKFHPFQMEIKGSGAFPNLNRMNVIWVGISEGWSQVQQIYEQTEKIFANLGFARENRPFTPHITIARVRSSKNRSGMADFLGRLTEKSFGSFQVEAVRLKQSILSSQGPRYSKLYEALAQN